MDWEGGIHTRGKLEELYKTRVRTPELKKEYYVLFCLALLAKARKDA